MQEKNKTNYSLIKAIVCFVFVIFFGYTLITQQFSISAKKAELKELDQQMKQAEAEQEELENQLKTVNTPEYIEKVAREELGYAAPDEIVFMDATAVK